MAFAAGCGREEPPNLVNGKQLFAGKGTCGSCHELARAGTKGQQGPSLDQAFATSRLNGLGRSTIEGIVLRQIEQTRRGSIMKSDLVTGDDARDVAAYVALVAGIPGKDAGELASVGGAAGADKTTAAKAGVLEIPADPSGALAFAFGKATAKPGELDLPDAQPLADPAQHRPQGRQTGPVVGNGRRVEVLDAREGRQLRVLLLGARPRGGRHEGHAHRQVASDC